MSEHRKDFLGWIGLKQELDKEENRPHVKIREVRWCAIGHNVGSEIDGKGELFARPVLILKILSSHTCLIIPLTHSKKEGTFIYEFEFQNEKIKARLDQARVVDTKRLKSKIGELPSHKFETIKSQLKVFLFD